MSKKLKLMRWFFLFFTLCYASNVSSMNTRAIELDTISITHHPLLPPMDTKDEEKSNTERPIQEISDITEKLSRLKLQNKKPHTHPDEEEEEKVNEKTVVSGNNFDPGVNFEEIQNILEKMNSKIMSIEKNTKDIRGKVLKIQKEIKLININQQHSIDTVINEQYLTNTINNIYKALTKNNDNQPRFLQLLESIINSCTQGVKNNKELLFCLFIILLYSKYHNYTPLLEIP